MDDESHQKITMPLPSGIHARELLERGLQYKRATELLAQESEGESISFPLYFVLTHAIELMLKAFAVASGISAKKLKDPKVRHDPLALFRIAADCRLPHVNFLEHLCLQLSEMNSAHDFRYPTGYRLTVPSIGLCLPTLQELHDTISPRWALQVLTLSCIITCKPRVSRQTPALFSSSLKACCFSCCRLVN